MEASGATDFDEVSRQDSIQLIQVPFPKADKKMLTPEVESSRVQTRKLSVPRNSLGRKHSEYENAPVDSLRFGQPENILKKQKVKSSSNHPSREPIQDEP